MTAKDNNKQMFNQKQAIIQTPEHKVREAIKAKYKKLLVDKTLTYLEGHDFGVEDLPLHSTYKMNNLKTILWPVDYPQGKIDLNAVIKLLE